MQIVEKVGLERKVEDQLREDLKNHRGYESYVSSLIEEHVRHMSKETALRISTLIDWFATARLHVYEEMCTADQIAFNHGRGLCHKANTPVPPNATVESLQGKGISCQCCGAELTIRPHITSSHSMEQLGLIEGICPICP